ncbi:MAG: bifunctional DNA-formamidopyrimidine glycosylase/DNA-(apurinic or apyrimidinic site) lyase [Mycobacteriales bacterium]
MPELPEVEVVRAGLEATVVGRTVAAATVHHPRAVRRHTAGADDFAGRLVGRRFDAARRRGKYLWLALDSGEALVGHLGMSGQLVVVAPDAPLGPHLRVRVGFRDARNELRFVDQRTFGGLFLEECDPNGVPTSLRHIALDPFDPDFDEEAFVAAIRRRRTGLKRALLDQTLISGIGNIYADEALWAARLHGARPTETLRRTEVGRVVGAARDVMRAALAQGGTSFDALYVNVNGAGGYFERSLHAYGREGLPCERCGTPIRRESFMNRSSFSCPRCQPRPRRARY